jgi:hypothetical protein
VKPHKAVRFQSPEQIELVIRQRVQAVERLPPSLARQNLLAEISRLRAYADAKRWLVDAPE